MKKLKHRPLLVTSLESRVYVTNNGTIFDCSFASPFFLTAATLIEESFGVYGPPSAYSDD